MNKIYRVIWSAVHATWVVVSELAKAGGKKTLSHRDSTSLVSHSSLSQQAMTLPSSLTAVAAAVLVMFTASQDVYAVTGTNGTGASTSNVTQADTNGNIVSGAGSSAGSVGAVISSPNGYGGTGGANNTVIGSGSAGNGGSGSGGTHLGSTGGQGGSNNVVLGGGTAGNGGNSVSSSSPTWVVGGGEGVIISF